MLAPNVAVITTSGSASDETIGIMMTIGLDTVYPSKHTT